MYAGMITRQQLVPHDDAASENDDEGGLRQKYAQSQVSVCISRAGSGASLKCAALTQYTVLRPCRRKTNPCCGNQVRCGEPHHDPLAYFYYYSLAHVAVLKRASVRLSVIPLDIMKKLKKQPSVRFVCMCRGLQYETTLSARCGQTLN